MAVDLLRPVGFMSQAFAGQAGTTAALLPLTVATFVLAGLASIRLDAVCAAVVLSLSFVFPAVFMVMRGRFEFWQTAIWTAGLLGTIAPSAVRQGWAVPLRWRPALVLWALTIALIWPIVALREIDFAPLTLDVPRLSITGPPGVPPQIAVLWISSVALTLSSTLPFSAREMGQPSLAESAAAARDTLGAAVGVAAQLPEELHAAVLASAREAFVDGMQAVAAISVVVAIVAVLLGFRVYWARRHAGASTSARRLPSEKGVGRAIP